MTQYTYGHIQRLHILNLVPLYLIACYIKEMYGHDIMGDSAFKLMTSRLYNTYDVVASHPHHYLIDRSDLMSGDTTFIHRHSIPARLENSAKHVYHLSRTGKLHERST